MTKLEGVKVYENQKMPIPGGLRINILVPAPQLKCLRERYVSGACALNLVDIQEDLLHNALQTKLPLLHMLGYVAINSLTSLADSVAFLLSFQDRIQWQVAINPLKCIDLIFEKSA